MKYLWTNPQRNFMLLVRVKLKGRRTLVIPVSLWTLEVTLNALEDLAWLWEKLFIIWGKHLAKTSQANRWVKYIATMPASSILDLGAQTLQDLRKHGRFRMVEVDDGNNRIYIDLF